MLDVTVQAFCDPMERTIVRSEVESRPHFECLSIPRSLGGNTVELQIVELYWLAKVSCENT